MQAASVQTFMLSKGPIVLLTCFAAVLLWAGCSSDSEKATARMRPTLDARVRPLLLQGESAFQRGLYQLALALADSAERYEPEAAVIPFFRGSVYTAMNQFDAARNAYRSALELDPGYPEAHLRMGDIEFQLGHLRKALLLYKDEEAVAPSSALYARMGRTYGELGVVDSARMAYEKAVTQDSTNADAHMMYGHFLQETGQLEAALAHSRKALALQPENANYQFAVGSQLFRSGQLEEAVEYLKRAANAGLLHYPAQYNLGQVLARLGHDNQANYYLARADSARQLLNQISFAQNEATRDPDNMENWVRLGALYRTAGEYSQAIEAFSVAAGIQPGNLSVQSTIAEVMLANGNTAGAIRRFQAILDADQTRIEAWLNLGLAYAVAGNCDEARRTWETVLELRPGNATAEKYLAGLCQYTAK